MTNAPSQWHRFRGLGLVGLAWLGFCAPHVRGNGEPPEGIAHEIVLVIGAPGEDQYKKRFAAAAEAWRKAATQAKARLVIIGQDAKQDGVDATPAPEDRDNLQNALAALSPDSPVAAWFVYVGHGTFDGRQPWLNLRGPDVSAEDLVSWLEPLGARTLVVVHGGSAAGPWLPALSAPSRIILSATRSGDELNYARFGERFASAISAPAADMDQDGTTSLLEAFLFAAKQSQAYYAEQGRMATEHALIDDNGDKLGTPADWFQGTRVTRRPDNDTSVADGFRANQIALLETPAAAALSPEARERRDALEAELEKIRARREALNEAEYLRQLERVLRRLSEFYR